MRAFFDHSQLSDAPSWTLSYRLDGGPLLAPSAPAPLARPVTSRAHRPPNDRRALLDRYLEGWTQADPGMIIAATAPAYRFVDPLVGEFCRQSLPAYFEHLRARFARAGATDASDFSFCFRGPMDAPPRFGEREYFREAPRLGLAGITSITIGECGIAAERVAYDLNLASEVLRCPA
jgi:hypothetical protein